MMELDEKSLPVSGTVAELKSFFTSKKNDEYPGVDIDDDGYPTDESLEALKAWLGHDFKRAKAFLLNHLPEVNIPCLHVCVYEGADICGRAHIVEFHTGGWSGAESLISTMFQSLAIRYAERMRCAGGHYYFSIRMTDKSDVEELDIKAAQSLFQEWLHNSRTTFEEFLEEKLREIKSRG